MAEAEDLLPLHLTKPPTQRKVLAMVHLHLDPIQSQHFLSSVLKFMYRDRVISTSFADEMEGNVRNHLQPAVALAIATKRRLGQRQSWRLPACINYQELHLSVECAVDGAWGSLSGSACLVYLVQRYSFMGAPRVSIYLYSSSTSMNSLTKLSHQVDSELSAIALGTKERQKAIQSLKEMDVKIDRTILVSDS
jgi:hypothetical protein